MSPSGIQFRSPTETFGDDILLFIFCWHCQNGVLDFVDKSGDMWRIVYNTLNSLDNYVSRNLPTFHRHQGPSFYSRQTPGGEPRQEGRFILTRGLESCLYLYEPEWFRGNLMSKLNSTPVKNQQDVRAFKRMLLAGAQEVELDPLGRILIPKNLSAYAQLKRDISILGVGVISQVRWYKQ